MVIKYQYLHNSNYNIDKRYNHLPTFRGYRMGDQLTLAYEGQLEIEGIVDTMLDTLWQMFNAPWERPNEYAGPSMSVGDVVIFTVDSQQEAHGVAKLGFASFNMSEVEQSVILPQPERWMRSGVKLREYIRAKGEEMNLTTEENAILYGDVA